MAERTEGTDYYSIYKSITGITFVIVFMISLLNLLTEKNFISQKNTIFDKPTFLLQKAPKKY